MTLAENLRPGLNFSCPFELASAEIWASLDPPAKEKKTSFKKSGDGGDIL